MLLQQKATAKGFELSVVLIRYSSSAGVHMWASVSVQPCIHENSRYINAHVNVLYLCDYVGHAV